MKIPKFSVIIPCYSELEPIQGGASSQRHYRAGMVQRAIKSIINQQFPDWELILVDDGCEEFTRGILEKFAASDKRIKVIHQENSNRAIARNNGMETAQGEWLCWLDSDDEYSSHYLREIDRATIDFPEYKIFNFGSLIYHSDHRSTFRMPFTPERVGEGHEWFRSGHIGAGSFVFRNDLWMCRRINNGERDWLEEGESYQPYRIPDVVNAYQFAADSRFDLMLDPIADKFQYENTENPEGAFRDGVYRHGLSLGNPWGDDALQIYLLTRDNQMKTLDILLYIQYARGFEEDVFEHFGAIYD